MSPECLHNQATTKASDIWSMGCILYQLYIGLPPFRGASDFLIFKLSADADFIKLEEYPDNILPQDVKTLIKCMIQINPEDRISIDEIVEEPFFDSVRHLTEIP